MEHTDAYTDIESYKKLIDTVGWAKALDIITSIDPLYDGDFAVDHKKMYAFSDECTAEIDRKIREEDKADEKAEQIKA